MAIKAKQVDELNTQATFLEKTVPEKIDDIKAKKSKVEERFEQLKAPLLERQQQLAKKKEAYQVNIVVPVSFLGLTPNFLCTSSIYNFRVVRLLSSVVTSMTKNYGYPRNDRWL